MLSILGVLFPFIIWFVIILLVLVMASAILTVMSKILAVIFLPSGIVNNKILFTFKNIILGLFIVALGFYVFLTSPAVIIQIGGIIIVPAGIFMAGASIREIIILKNKIEESKK